MTQENQANLLRTYRMAIEAGQDGIADSLEDIILDEMKKPITQFNMFRDIASDSPSYGDLNKVTCDAIKRSLKEGATS